MNSPLKIGVTGNYASGKSRVCAALAGLLQARYISADSICRQELEVNCAGWLELKKKWDGQYFLENGQVNRQAVRDKIFHDPLAKAELEAILHPLVRKEMASFFQQAFLDKRHVVAEIPLLFEGEQLYSFDAILTVFVHDSISLSRAIQRDGVAPDIAKRIIASQLPIETKVQRADYVIDNSETFTSTYCQLLHWSNGLTDRGL